MILRTCHRCIQAAANRKAGLDSGTWYVDRMLKFFELAVKGETLKECAKPERTDLPQIRVRVRFGI
jgi:hypothetical protein